MRIAPPITCLIYLVIRVGPFDKGTVAVAEIDGKIISELFENLEAPGYDQRIDGGDAFDFRKTLIEKYPDVMRTDNIGGIPKEFIVPC